MARTSLRKKSPSSGGHGSPGHIPTPQQPSREGKDKTTQSKYHLTPTPSLPPSRGKKQGVAHHCLMNGFLYTARSDGNVPTHLLWVNPGRQPSTTHTPSHPMFSQWDRGRGKEKQKQEHLWVEIKLV